jgi:hypothetical protein
MSADSLRVLVLLTRRTLAEALLYDSTCREDRRRWKRERLKGLGPWVLVINDNTCGLTSLFEYVKES